MSIETSNFAVVRNAKAFRVLGSDLASLLQENDILVLQRNGTDYKYIASDPIDSSGILDDDLFACTDTDDVTYKVTGAQVKTLLGCTVDQAAYNARRQFAISERSKCYLLCETEYCRSICDKMYDNTIWWAETDFLCYDYDREKPNGWSADRDNVFT